MLQPKAPLLVLAALAKQRQIAFEKTGTLTGEKAAAIKEIEKEAAHFGHLPPERQAFKVLSLKQATGVIRSYNPRMEKQNRLIDHLFATAKLNLKQND